MSGFAEAARRAGRVATGVLGWTPDLFWGATPAELLLALEGATGRGGEADALGSAGMAALEREFPDGRSG